MRLLVLAVLAATLAPAARAQVVQDTTSARATADTVSGPALSLDEALTLARHNNPIFLQSANDRRTADWQVRAARGGLLPQVDASFGSRYQQGGQQVFNGLSFQSSSDVLQSQYDLGVSYMLNGRTLLQPKVAAANRDATEANITWQWESVRAAVTQQYLNVLQAQEKAVLEDTLARTAEVQLELAKAKTAVGAGTQLDLRRAEVAYGQAQVAALQAHNQVEIEKVKLFQQLGVPQPAGVRLTTTFAVTTPAFTLDSLLDLARQRNPELNALRAREQAAQVGVRQEQSEYTPTLQLSTGWGGYTYEYRNADFLVDSRRNGALAARADCFSQDSLRVAAGLSSIMAQCSAIDFTPQMASDIRRANNQFPFNFTRAPLAFTAQVSFPIFDGFSREQRVEQSIATRDDARYAVRARELQLRADVTSAYLQLMTAARTVALQADNAAKARDELAFAEERYRVGAATSLDVTQARGEYAQAETDHINAIYDYHKAFAVLESAVGRPLR